jgi:ribose/xylose/arabinose/galactoside ABC-type transport system permease subunit
MQAAAMSVAPMRAGVLGAAGIVLMIGLALFRPEAGTVATMAIGIGLLALGQGAVMRRGGFDLAMPSMIAASGMAAVTISQGAWPRFILAFAVILAAAALLGLWHAFLARRLGRGIVLATLATGGLAQAVATAMFVWAPSGFVPLDLTALVSRSWLRLPLAVWVLLPIGVIAGLVLDRAWRRGHRGLSAGYVASALAAAVFGMLAAAIGGNFRLGLVDTYLVPAVAGAVIGGVRFARGDGSLFAAFGAALLVQAADTLLVSLGLSYEARLMAVALAMLAAATLPRLGTAGGVAPYRRSPAEVTARRLPSSDRG